MSGAQTSASMPLNQLYDMVTGQTGISLQQSQNKLLQQQQEITDHDIALTGQAAAPLLNLNEDQAAAAYPGWLQEMQSRGLAKYAPATYPGHAATAALVQRAMPILQQIQTGFLTTPGSADATKRLNDIYTGAGTPPTTSTSGGTTAADPATSGAVEPDALARAQAVRDGFIKRGLDVDTATGLAANALHESSANPNTGPGDAGASHGLFQLQGDRYNRYIAINGHPPDNAPLDEQLDFAIHEFNTTEGAARDRIAAAQGPAAKAAAISQYYLRPKDVQPEIARRSATATQLATQWGGAGTSTGQPVITGDSLASQGGLGGSGVVGASPKAVLSAVQADSRAGKYSGQPVVLSTGASNDPTDIASVEQQIREAQGGNAGKITVLGVGPGVEARAPGTNAKLQALATSYGANFVPLPADQMSPDGVHPTAQGYATLKAAIAPSQGAPGGVAARTGGVNVAGPGAGSGATVAAPAATAQQQAQVPQPPANRAMPGGPDGPPAPQQPPAPVAQPPAARANLPRAADVPQGLNSPQIQQAQRLQQAASQIEMEAARNPYDKRLQADAAAKAADLKQRAQILMQTDNIVQTQEGQLHTLTGQIEKTAAPLPNYVYDPTQHAYIDTTGTSKPEFEPAQRDSAVAQRDVMELGPKVANGTATPQEQARYATAVETYRQPELRENPVTKETVRVNKRELPAGFPEPPGLGGGGPGGAAGPGGSNVVMPGLSSAQQQIERDPAKAKVADMQYERDSKNVGDLTTGVTTAQNDNLRTKEMLDLLNNGDFSSGPGSETRTRIAAWFQRWAPASLTGWEKQSADLRGAAAAQAFQKLAFQGVTTQEKESSPRGGILATQLFQRNNPGLDLLNPANVSLLDMKLIQNQANIDYGRDALGHFTTQETRYGDTHKYSSLAQFDTQWINQRQPQVYAAAMGAVSGQPVEKWADGLSDAEYARALGIVERAKPGAVVNGKSGRIIVQPKAPTPPPGFQVIQ